MNILVFNPPGKDNIGFVREGRCEQRLSSFQYVMLPVSLTTIAALLRQEGLTVKIIDAVAETCPPDVLKKEIKKFDPKLVIFNISTVTYRNDIETAREIKEYLPGAHFTAIGVHVTATCVQTLKDSVLDSVVRGEPELITLNLAKALKEKKPLTGVRGISFKQGEEVKENPDEKLIEDLDKLPFPARDLVKNELYTLPVINKPYTLLIPSRGCPGQCIFCTANIYYGRKLRFRSVENVIAEIREIVDHFHIGYITMWSDTFTFKKNFVIDLCKRIVEEKIDVKWMCNSRVDTIDEEMLKWMKQAGCMGISFGIESTDPVVLKNIRKNISLDQIERAIRLTNKYDIESLAHIIFGLPGDTREKILATVKFIKKLKPSYAQFYSAVPFPGTEFYSQASKNNWLTTYDWSLYEINRAVISTPLLSAKELDGLRKAAYIRFYLSAGYIWNRLTKIKSLPELWTNVRQAFNFLRQWVM